MLISMSLIGLLALIVSLPIGHYKTIIHSDGLSYYAYLPATFIDNDPTFERLSDRLGGRFPSWVAIRRYEPTGLYFNKYPIGVALLQLPLFIIAHGTSLAFGLSATGYENIYQTAVGFSGLIYMLLGVAILIRLLIRSFSYQIVIATTLCIVFGTNLFNYGTFDATMSHTYSFFLITALLAVVPLWYEQPSFLHSILLGLIAGLIVLVRNPNILFLLMFPLYNILDRTDVAKRLQFYKAHLAQLSIIVAVGFLILMPQLIYWHAITGQWLMYSYQGESFNFLEPRLLEVLFSTQKGLFFWSPILLLTVVGLCPMRHCLSSYWVASLVILSVFTYLVSSWGSWQYGWSYGHRAFTDSMGIFALGMASLFSQLHGRMAMAIGTVCGLCVLLSIAQMIQYWIGIMPPENTTWEIYQSVFLRFS